MRTASRLTSLMGGLLALASLLAAAPSALQCQQEAETETEMTDERLVLFVRVHLEVVEAREEFNQAIAVTHDDPGKAELRSEMDQRLTEIYESHGMTQEEYELVTLEISRDQARREEFERLVAKISGT